MPTPPIKKIVLTGGPCGGKSTASSQLVERFEGMGWDVRAIPEVSTLFIGGGMKPWLSSERRLAFQRNIVNTQMSLEKAFEEEARATGRKTLILCDRGVQDGAAYSSPEEWSEVLKANGLNEITARDTRYDAVLHLVTAADGAPEFYTLANNSARTETPEQARALDRKTLGAWIGHPHLREIRNTGSFDQKLNAVLAEVSNVLGEPEPIEDERKFLVDTTNMPTGADIQHFDIVQHYLRSDAKSESRVRRRGRNGNWIYTMTTKEAIPGRTGRVEQEQTIPGEIYAERLRTHPEAESVEKTRGCMMHEGRYLEIDQFVWPKLESSLVEVETSETGHIDFPPWMKVLREVTGDPAYSNKALARLASAQRQAMVSAPHKVDLERAQEAANQVTVSGIGRTV